VRAFDAQLLRLKQVLGITEDQQVAAALGMTKAGFSARKARESFPQRELFALAETRPELALDVAYVLTGESQRQKAVKAAASALEPLRRMPDFVLHGADGQVIVIELKSPRELKLLKQYRSAEPTGKRAIEATAAAVAKDEVDVHTTTRQAAEPTNIRQRFEAAVGQVSGRDIVNRGAKVDVRTPAKKR
jgi:hypothetical protein